LYRGLRDEDTIRIIIATQFIILIKARASRLWTNNQRTRRPRSKSVMSRAMTCIVTTVLPPLGLVVQAEKMFKKSVYRSLLAWLRLHARSVVAAPLVAGHLRKVSMSSSWVCPLAWDKRGNAIQYGAHENTSYRGTTVWYLETSISMFVRLRTKLSTSVAIICATAVLHNVYIQRNMAEVVEEEFYEDIFENIINREQEGIGLAHRNTFILRHFS